MKIQELLKRVDFDAVVPTLDKLTAGLPLPDGTARESQTIYYRMAYDEMLLTEPDMDAEPINVSRGEGGRLDTGSFFHLEGDCWDYCLGREIILGDGPEIADEELAAFILWNMTFYGFSQKYSEHYAWRAASEEFEGKIIEVYQRRMAAYGRIPFRKVKKLNIYDERYFAVEESELKNMKRRNRQKRMRDHRHQMLIKKYERMGKVKKTISRILSTADDFTESQFDYLYKTKWISDQLFPSFSADSTRRIDYILDLIAKYGIVDYKPFDSLLLMVTIDPNHPLTEAEEDRLSDFIDSTAPWNRCEYGVSYCKNYGPGAELLIVASQE